MNGIELIELLEDLFKNNNLLRGVNIVTDPYAKLEDYLPCILIDYGKSRLKTASKGEVIGYFHSIDFFCLVSAHNKQHRVYKTEAIELAEKLLKALNDILDTRVRIVMKEDTFEPQEIMIGSKKCSGILINKEFETKI